MNMSVSCSRTAHYTFRSLDLYIQCKEPLPFVYLYALNFEKERGGGNWRSNMVGLETAVMSLHT